MRGEVGDADLEHDVGWRVDGRERGFAAGAEVVVRAGGVGALAGGASARKERGTRAWRYLVTNPPDFGSAHIAEGGVARLRVVGGGLLYGRISSAWAVEVEGEGSRSSPLDRGCRRMYAPVGVVRAGRWRIVRIVYAARLKKDTYVKHAAQESQSGQSVHF